MYAFTPDKLLCLVNEDFYLAIEYTFLRVYQVLIIKKTIEPISKMQIRFEGKASTDEKAQHTRSM